MLTTTKIDRLQPESKPYKAPDGEGLYLAVLPSGTKVWRYAYYAANRKQQTKTYGRYPEVSLTDARRLHAEFKEHGDKPQSKIITFRMAAEKWLEIRCAELSNPKHAKQTINTVQRELIAPLGDKDISTIKRRELVEAVEAVAARGTMETAHRVAQRAGMIFLYAMNAGLIEHSPAINLTSALKSVPKAKHFTVIPTTELPALMQAINSYTELTTRNALMVLAHTFVRTKELRMLKWSHWVEEDNVLVIPEEIMKKRIPHVVPVTPQVKELLENQRSLTGEYQHVFASQTGRDVPISENTMLFALYRLGYRGRMTGHGFRALASSILNQSGLWRSDAIERQLAHAERNEVRAAYNRAEYLDERRKMMLWWSDYLQTAKDTGALPK